MSEIDERGLKAALEHYSEGGCMGLSDHEKREVVEAIILAYEQHRGKQQPVGFVSNCGIGQLEREGWVAISRTPVKTTDIGLYASPQPADVAALRAKVIEECARAVERTPDFSNPQTRTRRLPTRDEIAFNVRALATSGGVE